MFYWILHVFWTRTPFLILLILLLTAWQDTPIGALPWYYLHTFAVFWCSPLYSDEWKKTHLDVSCVWQASSLWTVICRSVSIVCRFIVLFLMLLLMWLWFHTGYLIGLADEMDKPSFPSTSPPQKKSMLTLLCASSHCPNRLYLLRDQLQVGRQLDKASLTQQHQVGLLWLYFPQALI